MPTNGSDPGLGAGCVAVVLAGGRSSRFGADKLAAPVGDLSLLDLTLAGLPPDCEPIVVGPERPLARMARPLTFVREDPPYAGPTAALLTGLRAALQDRGVDRFAVLPGDAPGAGPAAGRLLDALDLGAADVVVGTEAVGRLQPLQLALRRTGAVRLLDAAGPGGGRDASARRLIMSLDPPAARHELRTTDWFDVDTVEQLAVHRAIPAAAAVLAAVDAARTAGRAVVVTLDGPSGAGKSTLATAIALLRPATVVDGDDFYSSALPPLAGPAPSGLSASEIADRVIDWRRLRAEALEPLLRSEPVRYQPYDWSAGDGRLAPAKELEPADLLVVDGVYSARAELADLVDVSVYVEIDADTRAARLARRTADPPDWVRFWERGERAYFDELRPPEGFDLRVRTADVDEAHFRNDPSP